MARTFKPQFAIVDLSLRGTSGLDVARQLQADGGDAPLRLVALTGHRDDELRRACLAAGFESYLIKPDGVHRLLGVLARD